MPRENPRNADEFPPINPRVSPNICVRCRKQFQREDRLTLVYICVGVGWDSAVNSRCAAASPTYEMAHIDCNDPCLKGLILNLQG
jgi:hypothetical protein